MSSLPPPRRSLSDLTDAIADTKAPTVILKELQHACHQEKKAREVLARRIELLEARLLNLMDEEDEDFIADEEEEEETDEIDWREKF